MSDQAPAPLRCEKCEKANTQYTLRYRGVFPMTCMAFSPFIDDSGRRHFHNGNLGGGEHWECSNGHHVTEPPLAKCWCGWPVSGEWAGNNAREKRKAADIPRAASA